MSKLDNIKIPSDFNEAIDKSINKALEDKKKMRVRKRKIISAGLSGILILGAITLSSESTWAYIENITKQIETFFGREENEFDKYKFEGLQTVESNGLKYSIGEVILDDRQLIISMSVDYSNYKEKNYIAKENDFLPSFPTVTIDDLVFTGQSNSGETEKIKGEKKYNILFRTSLLSIDKDGDGYSETPYEILDKIKPNKDYDLKISFDETTKWDKNQQYNPILGKWEFSTKINASNILNDTKAYKVNKSVEIDEYEYKGEFIIEEVRVSPISVKVIYSYDMYTDISIEKRRLPGIIGKNQDGQELEIGPGAGGQECEPRRERIGYEFMLNGNEKSITIAPVVYVNDKPKIFTEAMVEIDID